LNDGDKKYSVRKSLERYGDTKTFSEIAGEVGCVSPYVHKIYKELFGRGKRQKKQDEQGGTGKQEPAVKQAKMDASEKSGGNPRLAKACDDGLKSLPKQGDTPSTKLVVEKDNGVLQAGGSGVRVAPLPDGAAIYTAVFEESRRSSKTIVERKMYAFACLNELVEDMHVTEGEDLLEDIHQWHDYINKRLEERKRQRIAPRQ